MNTKNLKLKAVDEVATALHSAICTMRVHGFYVQRDAKATGDIDQDVISVSCSLLGVEPTDENKHSAPVTLVANALFENAHRVAGDVK